MEHKIINIPIDIVLKYREFDRVKKPAPFIAFHHMETVDSLTEKIKVSGLLKPLILSVVNDKTLLTDGNHRASALKNLNYIDCPVEIRIYKTYEIFNVHTIKRFKPINSKLKKYLTNIL